MKRWYKTVCFDLFKWIAIFSISYLFIQMIDQRQSLLNWMGEMLKSLSPFLLAFLFAYLFNPIMKQFEKRFKLSRGKSVLATYLLVLIGIGVFVGVLGPMIYRNAMELIKQIPTYATAVTDFISKLDTELTLSGINLFEPIYDQLLKLIPEMMEVLNTSLTGIVSLVMAIMTGTGNTILAFFISVYVLLSKESFGLMVKKVSTLCIGVNKTNFFEKTIQLMHSNIGHYLGGKLVCSVFMAVFCSIGVMLFKGKYALLLGLIYGISNMIPLFGPIVGTAIVVVIHLFVEPWIAIALLIYLLIIQQVETLIIDPRFAGSKVGLTPFFTILGVMLGGAIGGGVGMILGVPILGAIKTLMVPWIEKKYDAKIQPTVSEVEEI